MKVIMRVSVSGTRDGAEWPSVGSAVELPDAEAVDLLNVGMAEPAPVVVESAAIAAPAKRQTRKRTT